MQSRETNVNAFRVARTIFVTAISLAVGLTTNCTSGQEENSLGQNFVGMKDADRIPQDKNQLINLVKQGSEAFVERLLQPELLKSIEWPSVYSDVRPVALSFDDSGDRLIVGRFGHGLSFWDLGRGELIRQIESGLYVVLSSRHSIQSRLQLIDVPDSRENHGKPGALAVIGDITSEKLIYEINGRIGTTTAVSLNNKTAAWMDFDDPEIINVYDTTTGRIKQLSCGKGNGNGVIWLSEEGSHLVHQSYTKNSPPVGLGRDQSGEESKVFVQYWDIDNGRLINETVLDSGYQHYGQPRISLDGRYAIFRYNENSTELRTKTTGFVLLATESGKIHSLDRNLFPDQLGITAFEFTSDSKRLIFVGDQVHEWDLAQKTLVSRSKLKPDEIATDIKFNAIGDKMAILTLSEAKVRHPDPLHIFMKVAYGKALEIRDLNGEPVVTRIPTDDNEYFVAFELSHDGRNLVTVSRREGSRNLTLKYWRLPK